MYTIVLIAPRDTPKKDEYAQKMGKAVNCSSLSVILPIDRHDIERGFSPHAHLQIVSRHAIAFYVPYDDIFYQNDRDYIDQIKMTHKANPSLPIIISPSFLEKVKEAVSGQGVPLYGSDNDRLSLFESLKTLFSTRRISFMPEPS